MDDQKNMTSLQALRIDLEEIRIQLHGLICLVNDAIKFLNEHEATLPNDDEKKED